MQRDEGIRQLIVALVSAALSFFVVGTACYYKVANVAKWGWRFSGPVALAGEMAGLFGGGLAALLVLIARLRGRRG